MFVVKQKPFNHPVYRALQCPFERIGQRPKHLGLFGLVISFWWSSTLITISNLNIPCGDSREVRDWCLLRLMVSIFTLFAACGNRLRASTPDLVKVSAMLGLTLVFLLWVCFGLAACTKIYSRLWFWRPQGLLIKRLSHCCSIRCIEGCSSPILSVRHFARTFKGLIRAGHPGTGSITACRDL